MEAALNNYGRGSPDRSAVSLLGLLDAAPGQGTDSMGSYSRGMEPSRRGHLPINGLQLYYEVHGELGASAAPPLLLIPGAFLSTDSMMQWVAAFLAKRPVIVFDQQGHGRTADTPRSMSYEQLGDDAAALLHALEVERADVMGYSQGGGVALQLALRHPQLVSKLVTMSATYRQDGWYPSVLKALEGLSGDLFADTPVGEAFRQHTADPKAFDAYIEKMRVLNFEDQNITDAQMRSIRAKTMVIVGDADGVRPEHAVAMFKLRGGGDEDAAATGAISKVPQARLVILPATSHISISAVVPILEPMITEFLDDVPPANPSLW
jgi:pimeloyl-ACP methyl ester carboxylesterase